MESHKVPVDMSHDHISKVTSLGKKEDGKEANELLNKACAQVQVSFNLYRTAILTFTDFCNVSLTSTSSLNYCVPTANHGKTWLEGTTGSRV